VTRQARITSYIAGRVYGDTGAATFANVNPATGEILAAVEIADVTVINKAVASAKTALQSWRNLTGAQRGRVLSATARRLRALMSELAHLEVLDTGKPITEANSVDVVSAADCLDYFGGVAAALHGQHIDLGPTAFGYTRREPLGVCVGIGAWNYPLQIAAWKAAPALAAGNTMVFKPSELTPTTAMKLAEIFTECGLPAGVFNVVHGSSDTGEALVEHPQVAKVSLTGSVPTGKRVMASAAATLKQVTMELGGKSPLIIFSDANLGNAISAAILGNFYTQGEVCSNATRVFVHEEIYDAFLEGVCRRVGDMVIGNPLDENTHVGSLISEAHLHKVMDYIDKGVQEGAKLLIGGRRVNDAGLARGAFMEPAVFAECTDDMVIVREEIFGPVMSVLRFTDEQEVIARANNTRFGLAAGVFTNNLARGHRVVAALEAGTCWINSYNITPIELPFGGIKQSGLGRENSLAAMEAYTQLKSVYVELDDVDSPY
jgi:betaine-aldehyde dehydrogenase